MEKVKLFPFYHPSPETETETERGNWILSEKIDKKLRRNHCTTNQENL